MIASAPLTRDASKNTGSANTSATWTLSQALASGTSSNSKMFVMRTSVVRRALRAADRAGRDERDLTRASNVRTATSRRGGLRPSSGILASGRDRTTAAHSGTVSEITTP